MFYILVCNPFRVVLCFWCEVWAKKFFFLYCDSFIQKHHLLKRLLLHWFAVKISWPYVYVNIYVFLDSTFYILHEYCIIAGL
jgi:hypothetical protein